MQEHHQPAPALLPTLWQALHADPESIAIFWQDQTIRRGQLLRRSMALAAHLRCAGITHGSLVAVLLPRCPDMLVVLLALWYCGAVYVPLDAGWPSTRIVSALGVCNARFLLTRAALQALWGRCDCSPLLLEPIDFSAEPPALLGCAESTGAISCNSEDAAYLLFTSGSSGTPKAVQVNHGALAALFSGLLPLLQLRPGWRLLGSSSFCFDIVFFEWLAPLLASCSLVLADEATQRDPLSLLRLAVHRQVDLMQATPSLWRLLLQSGSESWPALQLAITTGEALDTITAGQLLQRFPALWNLYGPTECTLWSSARRVTAQDLQGEQRHVSIGKPLPGYHFDLLQHAGLAEDCGELQISGRGVATGYVGAEPVQEARFTPASDGRRSFRSGDLCRRDSEGNYHFLRRCDGQLKINGYRIEAGDVEVHLRSHPGIRDAVCLARELPAGSQLLAFVICEAGSPNKDRERWNRHLRAALPDWMLPHRYLLLDAFPLDANGKLDRRALLQLAYASATEADAHGDALQAEVGRIFCSVLELDQAGPCDSFFDLGGNSMLSAALLLALNQRFATTLVLRDILQTPPTVQRLTRLLRQAGAASCDSGA